jgi:hypothetical protein
VSLDWFKISPENMIPKNIFTIGNITISVEGEFQPDALEIPPAYRPFIEKGKKGITLRLHAKAPVLTVGEKIFESPPIWSLYRHNGASILRIFEHLPGNGRTLVLTRNAENTDLYFDDPHGPFSTPFYGPTMELLMVHYLAAGRGIIVHGCGIKHNGRGLLFVGESGAGKTTMAGIWSRKSGVEILSDDRTIVRKQGDHFVMYGTPWHGEGKFGSPSSAKLDQIFFTKHGSKNIIEDRNDAFSVTQFLKCSFPPLWDAEAMKYAMELFSDLVAAVPCRELSFKPDRGVIEFVNSNRTEG